MPFDSFLELAFKINKGFSMQLLSVTALFLDKCGQHATAENGGKEATTDIKSSDV